jgi:hypothetical protein
MKVFLRKLTPRGYDEEREVWTCYADFMIDVISCKMIVKGFMIRHKKGKEVPLVIWPHTVNKNSPNGKQKYTLFMFDGKEVSEEFLGLARREILDKWPPERWKLGEAYYHLNQGIAGKKTMRSFKD